MSEVQLLRDPGIEPTDDVIFDALGLANTAYVKFMEEIKNHDIQVGWRYYNDGMAWLGKGLYKWIGARGGLKEITVFWVSIWDGFFKATIYIPEKARADVLSLALADETKKIIGDAKQMGKLKFFPLVFDLRSDELYDDIYALVDFRKTLK